MINHFFSVFPAALTLHTPQRRRSPQKCCECAAFFLPSFEKQEKEETRERQQQKKNLRRGLIEVDETLGVAPTDQSSDSWLAALVKQVFNDINIRGAIFALFIIDLLSAK